MDKELKGILEVISKRVKTMELIMLIYFYLSIVGGVIYFFVWLSEILSG
ncbi:hypothetical protein LCGC14_1166600 [marine sediment metagenome]|uniref:Uncharacterized protein n=1 Tax=marine sediment metagenome TaxID=412755 RepID=A0A0F9FZP2_9ZZZZ